MEKKQKELLIIMPAYNEAGNIENVLDKLEAPEIASIADLLVMNDASSDNTNWIVKKRKHALVTYVIQMDADGQHDVCNIPVIYKKLKEADANGCCPDIVLGSRFLKESSVFRVSAAKMAAYHIFRKVIKLATGRYIADPTTGLQGLSRRAVLHYSKYRNFDDKYPDANMIIQMLLLGFNIEEIPAVMHSRVLGKSMHSGFKPFLYMFRMTFSIFAVIYRIKVLKWDSVE